MPKLKKIIQTLFYLYLFLLPFQTRYIYFNAALNGGAWEYGTRALYATEILLLVILFLFIISSFIYLVKNKSVFPFKENLRKNLKTPHILLPILFLIWSAISILWSSGKSLSFYKLTVLLEGVIIFFFLAKKIIPWKKAAYSFIAGMSLQAGLGICQFLTQKVAANKWLGNAYHIPQQAGAAVVETQLRRWLRAYGTLPHPNIHAAYLGVALILYIALVPFLTSGIFTDKTTLKIFIKAIFKNLISALIFFLLAAGILFAFSRAVFLGLIAALAGYGIYKFYQIRSTTHRKSKYINKPRNPEEATEERPKDPAAYVTKESSCLLSGNSSPAMLRDQNDAQKITKPNIFTLGFAILLIITAFTVRDPLIGRIKGENRLEKNSNQSHIITCKEGLEIVKDKRLIGAGIGNYTLALLQKKPGLKSWDYQPAHNLFIMVWAELGIIGFAIFILFCYYLITQSLKKKNIPCMALLIFILTISLFDHYFWTLYPGIILWWFGCGIIFSASAEN